MPRFGRVRQRSARPPKVAKPKKPKTKELRMALRGIVSALAAYRINSMAQALQWYDAALPYVLFKSKGQFDTKTAKLYDLAMKCRNQGIGTTQEGEKETSFRKSLELYEKVCNILHPPTVESFYKKYDEQKDKLDRKHGALQDRFENILDILTKACAPKAHDGQPLVLVAGDIDTDRKNDAMLRQLIYSREKLKTMKADMRSRGVLPVVFGEIPHWATSAGLQNQDGRFLLNPVKRMEAYDSLMAEFVKFCQSPDAPKRLVKNGDAVVAEPADPNAPAKAPRVRTPRTFANKGPLNADGFVEGSRQAQLFTIMLDGVWRTKVELRKLMGGSSVRSNLKAIQMKGAHSKKFTLEQNGSKFRLVKGGV